MRIANWQFCHKKEGDKYTGSMFPPHKLNPINFDFIQS
ncbi:hypothetical protein RINTHM_7530 [Richelia intracellularis HM01]|nr:hypothetical protein RINTHM_7530 [Richelia intracellularis HM01]